MGIHYNLFLSNSLVTICLKRLSEFAFSTYSNVKTARQQSLRCSLCTKTMEFNKRLNVVKFIRRCAAERTRTAKSRRLCNKRRIRIASDYPARRSSASVAECVCFFSFCSWQTVSSREGEYQQSKFALATETVRAAIESRFSTCRPAPQETVGRLLGFVCGCE